MNYQGYQASVTFDEEADIFHGSVVNTRDVITFQGRSIDEIRIAFKDSVNEYLKFCAERGREPEKPYSGRDCTQDSVIASPNGKFSRPRRGQEPKLVAGRRLLRRAAARRTRWAIASQEQGQLRPDP